MDASDSSRTGVEVGGRNEVVVEVSDQRERPLRSEPEAVYWLIEKIGEDTSDMLTVDLRGDQQALPVFSYQEEAEMFLWLAKLADRWRARKSEGRELARVLTGPCQGVGFVAFDPLPRLVGEGTFGPVGLTRERFALRLMRHT